MRFLVDQDVYQATIQWLTENVHDLILAKDLNLQRAPDAELLEKAGELDRLLLTRDKDFGTLVFLQGEPTQGVEISLKRIELLENYFFNSIFGLVQNETQQSIEEIFEFILGIRNERVANH